MHNIILWGCFGSDEFGHLTALSKLWFNRYNTGGNEPWQEEKIPHRINRKKIKRNTRRCFDWIKINQETVSSRCSGGSIQC
jgi:hypothetical protein